MERTWHERPALVQDWDRAHQYLMSIDENGTADLSGVTRAIRRGQDIQDRYRRITITGVVLGWAEYQIIKKNVVALKNKYWEDGLFLYRTGRKRVCFHSREVRKRTGPFGALGHRYDPFYEDLQELLRSLPAVVFSSSIDKLAHVRRYVWPDHPYNLSLKFILERYCMFLNKRGATGLVLVEGRGEKEDKIILSHALDILRGGSGFMTPRDFACIRGIYFNPKWNPDDQEQTSYFSLELADLISYPIFQLFRDRTETPEYENIKRKLANYPNVWGYGLKWFP